MANHFYFSGGPQILRLASMILTRQHGQEAYPLFDEFYDSPFPTPTVEGGGGNPVIEVVLKALPLPGESVAWDDIFAFREDPSAWDAWLRLRDWTADLGKVPNLTAGEIEDKCASLMDQYRTSMRLHKIRSGTGSFETIVTTTAAVAEALSKLQFSKLAHLLFTLRRRRADLLHSERTVPGAAVGYIVKAGARFR